MTKQKAQIAIIDYGFGNIKSVANAIIFLGAKPCIIDEPSKLSNFCAAILPGVGAFGPAIDFLKSKGFDEHIKDFINNGKMLYGICLGFQLLFTKSYEHGEFEGLNLLKGEVKKFEKSFDLRVPHIGWNNIELSKNSDSLKMFSGISDNEYFYFVHSYYVLPQKCEVYSSSCKYGVDFCSSAAFKNIWGSQFHPEKSGKKGLKILSNFIEESLK
ncbi:MAG: imidazole glycerol phosphate synthase subunit HisH [Elusimicrobiota bacterium]|jgi:glutamine amidotransferase|nr:imidazole glycerol phosphate synthase subunit HisH [Elusimicrobiota bacterium]